MRQRCEVCGVEIDGECVFFSFPKGNVGSRARLRARVCQYAKRPGCINEFEEIVEAECWKPI